MQAEVKKLVPEAPLPTVAPMGTDLTQVFIPNDSIKRKPFHLFFVGRLVEKKRNDLLLKALPKIIKHHPKTILNIAGTGPKQAWFEELIKELKIEKHVNFLGRLPHHALVKEFCEASIGMFPFIQEGLGLVTIEAMGCGLPVIVSNIPAMHDILIEGKTGLFVKPKNPLEIANKVIMLMDTPQLAQNLGKQGREQVLKKFSWEVAEKKYLSILKKYRLNEAYC
jgi:glycosyltransferase involved in cell wall biosynthesis